jgi:hypothetical protein
MKKNHFSSGTGNLCAYLKPSKFYYNKWVIAMFSLFLFFGCKKVVEESGLIGICPTISSVSPADASGSISINSPISAVFTETMDASTISIATFTVKEGAVPIAGVIAFSGTTATFTPTMSLNPNTKYTATMNAGVRDLAHNAMISDYVWSFTTGADPAPMVTSTDPINLAIAVAFNKKISVAFSKPMDSLSATMSFSMVNTSLGGTNVSGSVIYTGTTAVFSPSVNLLPSTTYAAKISTVAKDVAGTFLKNSYSWSFTTGKAPDIIAPIVVSTDPINSAIGIPFNQKLSANFSETMDPATVTAANFKLANTTQGGLNVNGVVLYSGTTATFKPTAVLLPNTTYTATISTAVKDLAAVSLQSNYVWSFTTGNVADAVSPTIVSTDPARYDIGVPLNKTIAALFSESMDQSTITTASFTLANATLGGLVIPGTVSYTGVTAVFSPLNNLSPNTTYTASVNTGAKDLAGNSIVSNYFWSFTTGTATDLIAPTVLSTDPINNATGVALNKKIAATFSESMNPASISITSFLLMDGSLPITGTVTYVGNIGTFSPSANLTASTLYTATITTIAKDLAGNPLASNYVWTFTTGAALDIIAPTVILTDPINNAIGVAIDKKIVATFSESMDPLTISTVSYTLKNGTTSVAGNVSYLNNVATFSPLFSLLLNTVYTATITTAAKDLAGNAMLLDYVWTFTTALPTVPPVVLGSAANFGVFGGNAGTTNQGLNTVINNGGIGTTAASTLVTGFHDGITAAVYTETPLNVGNVTGGIFTAPPAPGTAASFTIATNALNDATIAYNSISPASRPGGIDPGAGELGGLTLAPGVYQSASGTFKISNGDLTLDAKGDPNATWIFQTASGLTVGIAGPAGARNVLMINGGLPKNVYWYVGSAATINGAGGGVMVGTIISYAGVTFSTSGNTVQTVLNGRAISLNASVTMVNTTINVQ